MDCNSGVPFFRLSLGPAAVTESGQQDDAGQHERSETNLRPRHGVYSLHKGEAVNRVGTMLP